MEKKHKILIIGVIVFIVMVYFLYNSSKNVTNVTKNEDDNQIETTNVADGVNLIDYLNLEGENRKLKEDIDLLKSEIFELNKLIANSEQNNISHYYNSENFLYKEVTDNEIIILSEENDFINGYILSITTKEENLYNHPIELKNNEVINYTGTDGFYSGLIDGNVINDVIVEVNDKSYEAEIVNIKNNISFWYTMYEHKRKSTSEKPDKIRIRAVNELGEVLWEESFDGSLGG